MIAADTRVGKYRVISRLGMGGMADVYRAHDEELGRTIALKVLPPEFARDQERVVRFDKEVRAVAKLNHPHIVTVYDVYSEGTEHFYTMDLIPGGDLKSRIKGGMAEEEILRVLREIASALGYAHDKGFIHRDLKPENILFREDGSAVLTDFGIAKVVGSSTRMTRTGMSIGTPHYMSPEQARGLEVDHRSDLYSLGILFYEMLTGNVPYDAPETFAVGLKHINDPIPVLPETFRRYQAILDHLLAKNPGNRYENIGTLLVALNQVADGRRLSRPSHATKVMAAASSETGSSGRGWKWGLGGAFLALVIGLAGFFYLPTGTPQPPMGGGAGGSYQPVTLDTGTSQPMANPFGQAGPDVLDPPSSGILVVNTTPEGADVFLGNRFLGKTPFSDNQLPIGSVLRLRLEKEHHVPFTEDITLQSGQEVKKEVILERGRGLLTILSDPAGAEIWLDGRKRSEICPATLSNLSAGRYRVKLHKDRYYDQEEEVVVKHGETALLELSLSGGDLVKYEGEWLPPEEAESRRQAVLGHLWVQPEPPEARVRIMDIVPPYQAGMSLSAGSYTVEVSHAGYMTSTETVELAAGENLEVPIRLEPIKGYVKVISEPSGAIVRLGTRRIGSTPLDEELEPGEGLFELSLAGYQPASRKVVIKSGERTELSVRLIKEVKRTEQTSKTNMKTPFVIP